MPKKIIGKSKGQRVKNLNIKFIIDCSQPVEDKVLTANDFSDFLKKRIKIKGHTGNFGTDVALNHTNTKIELTSDIPFSKRYLKYLTKKYLKK